MLEVAPTDAAFENVACLLGAEDGDLSALDEIVVTSILQYHVTEGIWLAQDLEELMSVNTLADEMLPIGFSDEPDNAEEETEQDEELPVG